MDLEGAIARRKGISNRRNLAENLWWAASFTSLRNISIPLQQTVQPMLQYSSESDGVSPSGKAAGFGLAIPRFES